MSNVSAGKISSDFSVMLELLGEALFGVSAVIPPDVDWNIVCGEAYEQAVLPLVLSVSEKHGIPDKALELWLSKDSKLKVQNLRSDYDHAGLHRLLTRNNIEYTVIKGCASAAYYPEPCLRTMGDVDIFVKEADIHKVCELLESRGFEKNDKSSIRHIGYQRRGTEIEVHRGINGVPEGDMGKLILEHFDGIFDRSEKISLVNGECLVPCPADHGLILLLHTALHMTNSGVGIRQICDWLVFSQHYFSNEFADLLKSTGLWRFACVLTQIGEKWLKMPENSNYDKVEPETVDSLLSDLFNGGNFGKKDRDRFRQIKYITTLDKVKVDKKSSFRQLISSMNHKVRLSCGYVRKHKALYPIGWIQVSGAYFKQLIKGERSLKGGTKTISKASERKEIYRSLRLFEKEK